MFFALGGFLVACDKNSNNNDNNNDNTNDDNTQDTPSDVVENVYSYDFSIDEEKFSYESKVSECQKISDGIYCDDERYYFIIGDKFAFTYKDYFEDFYPATRGNAKEEYDE